MRATAVAGSLLRPLHASQLFLPPFTATALPPPPPARCLVRPSLQHLRCTSDDRNSNPASTSTITGNVSSRPAPQPRGDPSSSRSSPARNPLAAPPAGLRPEPWTGSAPQLQALELLRRRLQAGTLGCPDDETLRWFLRDRKWDVGEAEGKLRSTLAWRREFLPTPLTPQMVSRELGSGKAFIHTTCDVFGRPVLVVNAALHVTGQYASADSKRLCVYLLDQAIQALPPGQEQILGVFDLRGFGLQNADFEFARFMVEAFFEYYPRRVSQVLFVEAPWVFRPAWETIRPLMRKYAELVRFVSVSELREQYFTTETVPASFKKK